MRFVLAILLLTPIFSAARIGNVLKTAREDVTDELIRTLKLPEGFKIAVFARGLNDARMLAAGPRGTLFVTRPDANEITCLRDENADGVAEISRTALTLPAVHGIAVDGRRIFVANPEEVHVGEIQNDCKISKMKRIISGLPDPGGHNRRTLLIGVDRKLYVSLGSSCNACKEKDERLAAILQSNLDGSGLRVFAKGLRNTIGFALHPDTKNMWGMDHGIDWEGDDQPGEELNLIEDGIDYGWPKTKAGRLPVLTYTAHAAPIGMTFYNGTMFPAEYRGDAFVAFHGSWNRKPPSGYEVVRVRFKKGKPVKFEPFLSGFLLKNGTSHFGRPSGIMMQPDGSLLVADDSNGVVYRISRSAP